MFAIQNNTNLFAVTLSLGLSAVLFATAIIPASPALIA